jgi:hypothetical protein
VGSFVQSVKYYIEHVFFVNTRILIIQLRVKSLEISLFFRVDEPTEGLLLAYLLPVVGINRVFNPCVLSHFRLLD